MEGDNEDGVSGGSGDGTSDASGVSGDNSDQGGDDYSNSSLDVTDAEGNGLSDLSDVTDAPETDDWSYMDVVEAVVIGLAIAAAGPLGGAVAAGGMSLASGASFTEAVGAAIGGATGVPGASGLGGSIGRDINDGVAPGSTAVNDISNSISGIGNTLDDWSTSADNISRDLGLDNTTGDLAGNPNDYSFADAPDFTSDDGLGTQGSQLTPAEMLAAITPSRTDQLEQIFQQILTGTQNPFLREGQTPEQIAAAEEEFRSIVANGMLHRNSGLGDGATDELFSQSFSDPQQLGDLFLDAERDFRINDYTGQVESAFPGDAFSALDDDIISSIVDERKGPALGQISNYEARGNLNPLGGQTANQSITSQTPAAIKTATPVAQGIQSKNQADVNAIRDSATAGIGNYQLGDDLFDVAPFVQQRQDLIDTRIGSFGDDLRSGLEGIPLFNVNNAFNEAGRAQGIVSGQSNNLLDTIAAREAGTVKRDTRGLGTQGSGTF